MYLPNQVHLLDLPRRLQGLPLHPRLQGHLSLWNRPASIVFIRRQPQSGANPIPLARYISMNSSRLRVAALGVATGLLALPVRFVDPMSGLVRVNEACSQATDCDPNHKGYICSKASGDEKDAKCAKGCNDI
jgi:hypothetical protein